MKFSKKFFSQLIFILGVMSLIACSRQWRSSNSEVNSAAVLGELTQTFAVAAQSGESSVSNFERIRNLPGTVIYYAEAVQGGTASFGSSVGSVFAIQDWSFLIGASVAPNSISSAKAYLAENVSELGSEYSLLLDVTSSGTRVIKVLSVTAMSVEGGEMVMSTDAGVELRTFDVIDDFQLANIIQLQLFVQGSLLGKITTMISL